MEELELFHGLLEASLLGRDVGASASIARGLLSVHDQSACGPAQTMSALLSLNEASSGEAANRER